MLKMAQAHDDNDAVEDIATYAILGSPQGQPFQQHDEHDKFDTLKEYPIDLL